MNIADLVFLRPYWLLLLLLLPVLWWLQRRQRAAISVWQQSVDKHLLAHLLQHSPVRGAGSATRLGLLVAALAIVAMAGPSWRQQSTPLWQLESPLVIALDLSSAMRAADLPPSRLIQARAKLLRLLEQRQGGQVGLLVYAGDAFSVAPITRDARTVSALVDSLDPALMPVDGQNSQRAIRLALKMLRDGGATRGEILLLSDRAEPLAISAAAGAKAAGFSVSVIGVGTQAGAPLTGANGFITGADGQPQLAKLDPSSLLALASAGGGRYASLTADDRDLNSLGVLDPHGSAQDQANGASANGGGSETSARSDDGYWLLLLLLPLVLLGFRRGWLTVITLFVGLTLLPPDPLEAADTQAEPVIAAPAPATAATSDIGWDALWQRADQRAYSALTSGEAQRALELAPNPSLKGAAAFRIDDFAGAEQAWSEDDSADGHYNRGTALAKAGKLQEALQSLDEALARQPDMEDALANRQAIEDFLKKQQQQQQQSGQKSDPNDQQDKSKQDQSQQSGEGGQKPADQQQSESPDGQQSDAEQKDGQSSDSQPGQDQEGKEQQAKASEGEGKDEQSKKDDAQASADDAKKSQQQRAAEAEQVRAAEEAAKRDMQKALAAADSTEQAAQESKDAVPMTAEERTQAEQQQATKQWLRRVPDDPGGLLRRKFEMEYRRRLAEGDGQ